MTRSPILAPVALGLAIVCAACTGGDGEADRAATERDREIWVAHFTTPCEGVGSRECLNVREAGETEWKTWYGPIEGFEYEPGVEYHVMVSETTVEDPPADASSIRWTLIEVLDETPMGPDEAGGDPVLRAWTLARFGPAAELGDEPSAGAIVEALAGLDSESPVTLDLSEEGRAAGFDGCNRYFGEFRVEYGHQIVQGPMASTMMACPDPLMELEQAYLRNLSEAARLFRRDGRLELENDDGVLLVFEPAAMEPAVD
jgi:hypothetical protein